MHLGRIKSLLFLPAGGSKIMSLFNAFEPYCFLSGKQEEKIRKLWNNTQIVFSRTRKDRSFNAGGFRRGKQNYFCLLGRFFTYYGTRITLKGHLP
jgi:hypothetical protein